MATLMEKVCDLGGGMLDELKERQQETVSSTNEWSPPPRVLHQGPRQKAALMTVCSNAVENLGISALTREAGKINTGKTRMRPAGDYEERMKSKVWESLRDSERATTKTDC